MILAGLSGFTPQFSIQVKAFSQLLESYRSLTLRYMAESFNVTEEYMDQELSRFIADGRLHCKIDKVSVEKDILHLGIFP